MVTPCGAETTIDKLEDATAFIHDDVRNLQQTFSAEASEEPPNFNTRIFLHPSKNEKSPLPLWSRALIKYFLLRVSQSTTIPVRVVVVIMVISARIQFS